VSLPARQQWFNTLRANSVAMISTSPRFTSPKENSEARTDATLRASPGWLGSFTAMLRNFG